MTKKPTKCKWTSLHDALRVFVRCETGHQGSEHIKPLHWYAACRLVLEGGFHPDEITPRPPFTVIRKNQRHILMYDSETGGSGERTILGGLKTKDVDVVVIKDGIGPVMAISMKGTLNAFRNLTNRMEEAVGDCTNLHIAYPAMVYGFFHVMRANRDAPGLLPADTAICQDGRVAESIQRYHEILIRLADRKDMRDDGTKYEAVALTLVNPDPPSEGDIITTFPPAGSSLLLASFFEQIYAQYDQRFVYTAPALEKTTRRLEWDTESPVVNDPRMAGYNLRIAHPEDQPPC